MEKSEPPTIAVNLKNTKYSTILNHAIEKMGWKTTKMNTAGKNKDWDILWTDSSRGIEQVLQSTKSYQKINHFPSMYLLTGKGHLARSISKMQRVCVASEFTPRTWILPLDYNAVTRLLSDGKNERCVIVKQCRGNYKYLAMTANMINRTEPCTVQLYINKPLLIDGYKFTLRVFVLVLSIDPLRLYIYKEGIVQLCTVPYSAPSETNIENTFMHMTSFSNSNTEPSYASSRDRSTVQDNTRTLSWLWNWLLNRGQSKDKVWQEISDIVTRTLISVQSPVTQAVLTSKFAGNNKNPFTCFELLAFDFLITDNLKPYLLSVKSSPSLNGSTDQESKIKVALCENTFSLLNMTVDERLRYDAFKGIESQIRLYGDAFDRKHRVSQGASYELKCSRKSDYIDRLNELPKSYWKRFLANEAKHMGNFQLLFPTDCYPQQPTAGKQIYYDKLLDLAEAMYMAATNGIFNGFLQPVEAHEEDEGKGSEQQSPQTMANNKDGQRFTTADKYAGSLENDAAQDSFLQAVLEGEKDEGKEIVVDDLFSSMHSSQSGGEYGLEQKEEFFFLRNQFPVIAPVPNVSGALKFLNIRDVSNNNNNNNNNNNGSANIRNSGDDSKATPSDSDNNRTTMSMEKSGMNSSFGDLQDLHFLNVTSPDASLNQRPRSSFRGGSSSTRNHKSIMPPRVNGSALQEVLSSSPNTAASSYEAEPMSVSRVENQLKKISISPLDPQQQQRQQQQQQPEQEDSAATRPLTKPTSPRHGFKRSGSNIKQRPLVSRTSTADEIAL